MKKTIAIMLLVCVGSVFAGYTYEIGSGEFDVVLTLDGQESLLMTGGWISDLNLNDWSSARIEGTDPINRQTGEGGIWELNMDSSSSLEILGGEIHELDFSPDVRGVSGVVTISGGSIDILKNQQMVDPSKNIHFICRDWLFDDLTNRLTGTWEDFTTFDILLVDVDVPLIEATIDNIQFTIVPEPTSLLLLGVGGLLLRKRKS